MKTLTGRQKRFDLIFFVLLFAGMICLSSSLMYKDSKPVTPGVFHSDKGQYYIYLPVTFIYHWDIQKLPHRIDTVYKGFVIDSQREKLVIKVTYGVALLASPFFLVTHGIAILSALPADGFSAFYEKMALITPVFYLVLGLFFLLRFLGRYVKRYVAYLTILFLLAGTNLFHYGLVEGWMSHVFSFFLFSLCLFLLKGFLDGGKRSYGKFLFIALVVSMAVLIRPTSILLLLWLVLLDVRSFREVGERILFFLRPKYSIPFALTGFVLFIPQFLYWHYLSGSYMFYSYPGESFLFWKNPMLTEVWFAPLNGLFLYNPLVLFMVAGIVFMVCRRMPNGWFLAMFFLLNSYLIASWHAWYFGGSYGCRPFVEYYALFALAFALLLSQVVHARNLFVRSGLILVMLLCSLYNLKIIYNPLWNTSSTWAWDDFRNYLDTEDIIHFRKDSYTHINDFENISFDPSVNQTRINVHSPTKACHIFPQFLFNCNYARALGHSLDRKVTRITVSCFVDPFMSDSSGGGMVCSVENSQRELLLYKWYPFNRYGTKQFRWTEISASIDLPFWMNDDNNIFRFYILNEKRTHFLVDDIEVIFE